MSLSPTEMNRLNELTAAAKVRRMEGDELNEWQSLGTRYADQLRLQWAVERRTRAEEIEAQTKARRDAGKQADWDRDLGHQISWLKAALNPTVSDEALIDTWLWFRSSVGHKD